VKGLIPKFEATPSKELTVVDTCQALVVLLLAVPWKTGLA
jgi:hypothetical protein